MRPQIVNIVNFIRALEPRVEVDLHKPVVEQIALMKRHNLRGTFLLQYDALCEPFYTDLLRSLDPAQFEFGVWEEVVRGQCEVCGIPWTGRYPWDWHAHCGFTVGYTKPQREALADVLFEKFREVFGYYPRVFGSWFFDSHTIRYISDRYGFDAICNCKEQYGTDGYTLWGAYWGQGYYPSRTNVFMPGQTAENTIPAPLFRMLGSDQVYQYDFGMTPDKGAKPVQGVITLEPVYTTGGGGGDPRWVDWFLRENFNGECLSFGYAQAGQENPFGWERMKDGLTYQFARFAELQAEGKLTVEPLGDTGRRYKADYPATPASAITAHSAWDGADRDSVWYDSRWYRLNLYRADGVWRVRDVHLFREDFADPFEDTVCTANDASYETLPLVDGNRWSGNGVVAGLYPSENADGGDFVFRDLGGGCARIEAGALRLTLTEDTVTLEGGVWTLRSGHTGDHLPEILSCGDGALRLRYRGYDYAVKIEKGSIAVENGNVTLTEDGGAVVLRMNA